MQVKNINEKQEISVSIICITFNQAKYIEQTLDSFLSQKVDFTFEILIHDDASNDETQEIIKSYQKKHPDIIKPVLQNENQYSKGGFMPAILMSDKAQGKYLAFCEGDDYWSSDNKLQKQFDELESQPHFNLVFHSSSELDCLTGNMKKINNYGSERCIVAMEKLISQGGGLCQLLVYSSGVLVCLRSRSLKEFQS